MHLQCLLPVRFLTFHNMFKASSMSLKNDALELFETKEKKGETRTDGGGTVVWSGAETT